MRGEHYRVDVVGLDGVPGHEGRRQITVRAGRMTVEHVVPPAGDKYAFDAERWEHRVAVCVSPKGRSVRVFVDGVEVGRRLLSARRP